MKIVNCTHDEYDVYGGRGSIFGNPYEIGMDGDREKVIARFKRWFYFTIRDDTFRKAVENLRGKRMGCFCKQPDREVACHLDVIKEYLDEQNKSTSPLRTYSGLIDHLGSDDVFVFGSNKTGFHGAGSAGYASFGMAGNHWREFGYDKKPNGWKGNWNVKGVARGFQVGTIGKSYAIITVERPGAKRSIPLENIKEQIARLYSYAKHNPQLNFYIAQENKIGLNGYTPEEMASVYNQWPIPDNIIFEEGFAKLL